MYKKSDIVLTADFFKYYKYYISNNICMSDLEQPYKMSMLISELRRDKRQHIFFTGYLLESSERTTEPCDIDTQTNTHRLPEIKPYFHKLLLVEVETTTTAQIRHHIERDCCRQKDIKQWQTLTA